VNALRLYHAQRWAAVVCIAAGVFFVARGDWRGAILADLLALLSLVSALCSLLVWRWGVK
jgi:drug/metabolite transporter (DMT)-like permease